MIIAIIAGIVVGILLGALGGGGAILAVPVLIFALGFPPGEASVASLVIVAMGSVTGLIPHIRHHNVQWLHGLLFGALGILGAFLGSQASGIVGPDEKLSLFAVLLLLVAATMIRKALKKGPVTEPEPLNVMERINGKLKIHVRPLLAVLVTATFVGFLTGMFGVGGGFVIVPALTLVLGLNVRHAVATSVLVILINAVISMGIQFDTLVDLNWSLVLPFALTAMVGSLIGGAVSNKLPKKTLSLSFAGLLILIAVYTATQSVPNLLG